MTDADVKARVAELVAKGGWGYANDPKAMGWDDELAHSMEDALWEDVLRAIADGAPNAAELAKAALATKELDFARWCA